MSYRLHPDASYIVEGDRAYALALPDGELIVLDGTAAVIFGDVAEGSDPVRTGLTRWGEEARGGIMDFLQQLEELNLVESDGDIAPRRAFDELSILFVCTANICRSAYADVKARAADVPGLRFASAGTHALVGHPMDPPMAAELQRRGIDPDGHAAQQLTAALVDDADLVVVMSPRHRDYVLEEWPSAVRKTFLIGHVAREIAASSNSGELLDRLWATRPGKASDAVPDPFSRGVEAARACASQLDEAVGAILSGMSRDRGEQGE